MSPLDSTRFARQVGFGLAPDEATPDDPLAWAQAQLDRAPAVAFLADRTGALMTGLPEGVRLLESQKDATLAMQGHWDAEKNSFEQSRKLPRPDWEKLRYETVDLPYWRMAPWQEVLARGAMAVNGPAPVFERFWHFWTNHFTVAPATNNINAMVGPYMRMLRGHMSGHFRDMLFEAVTHPAMVLYLDNAISTGPKSRNSQYELRSNGKVKHSINENLGRELLELFTVSPAAGYTQADVMGATFILTGWGVHKPADTWNKSGAPYGPPRHSAAYLPQTGHRLHRRRARAGGRGAAGESVHAKQRPSAQPAQGRGGRGGAGRRRLAQIPAARKLALEHLPRGGRRATRGAAAARAARRAPARHPH